MPLIEDGTSGLYFTGGLLEAEDGLYSGAVESGLTPTYLTWRGLLIADRSDTNTPFHLSDITGWEVTPQVSFDDVKIAGGRGMAVTPGGMGPRIVTATGYCFDQNLRNQLLAILRGYGAPSVGSLDTDALTVTHGGLTLAADAQLMKADASPEPGWGMGRFGFTVQWRCADPMRYGEPTSTTVPVAVPTLGITFGVSGSWVFPADPVGGIAVIANPGIASSDVVFTLSGPISRPGVAVVETGAFVTFDFDIAVGDSLTVDTAQGLCALNGVYRSPSVLSSLLDELRLPPNATSTVQALGSPQPGSPTLSVAVRPAYW